MDEDAGAMRPVEAKLGQFTSDEQLLIDVWEAHTASEFEQKDADSAIATMTDRPVLIHVPVNTGATGREALRRRIGVIDAQRRSGPHHR